MKVLYEVEWNYLFSGSFAIEADNEEHAKEIVCNLDLQKFIDEGNFDDGLSIQRVCCDGHTDNGCEGCDNC